MKLDFNKDGHVTAEDLKKGAQELYEFMMNYEYFQKATEIKNKLYHEAIKYMKGEIQNDQKKRQETPKDDDIGGEDDDE
jgi:hypothetical protein